MRIKFQENDFLEFFSNFVLLVFDLGYIDNYILFKTKESEKTAEMCVNLICLLQAILRAYLIICGELQMAFLIALCSSARYTKYFAFQYFSYSEIKYFLTVY